MFVPEAAESRVRGWQGLWYKRPYPSVPSCVGPNTLDVIRVIKLAGYKRFGLAGTDKMGMKDKGAVAKE